MCNSEFRDELTSIVQTEQIPLFIETRISNTLYSQSPQNEASGPRIGSAPHK